MENLINTLSFSLVCQALEKIKDNGQTNSEKMKILLKFRNKMKFGESMYPYIRLLMPEKDLERPNYNLAEVSLGKIYSEILNFAKTSDEYKLLNNSGPSDLDWSETLVKILNKRVQTEHFSDMEVGEVNERLDNIAKSENIADKKTHITELFARGLHPIEHKWMTRIIRRQLHININIKNFLNYFSPRAYERFKQCNDLKIVCKEDAEGIVTAVDPIVPANILHMMIPMGPIYVYDKVLDTKIRVERIEETLLGAPFDIDLKYDGWRILTHITTDQKAKTIWSQYVISNERTVMMVSRQLKSWTNMYEYLAQDIENCVKNGLSCVLDGEVIGWDNSKKVFITMVNGTNQILAENEKKYNESKIQGDNWLKYIVFDILYLDGEGSREIIQAAIQQDNVWRGRNTPYKLEPGSLTHLPLSVRKRILGLVIVLNHKSRVEFAKTYRVTSSDKVYRQSQLLQYFEENVVRDKQEGLVIKNLDSPYMIGKKSKQWMKLKPEARNTSEMDMVVLGADWGEKGTIKSHWFTHFLMGVKDDVDPSRYYPVGIVDLGLNHKDWNTISDLLKKSIVWDKDKHDKHNLPSHLSHLSKRTLNKLPTVLFSLTKSVVFQIGDDQLIESRSYPGGYTFRFPRIVKWRSDKSYDDIMTLNEFVALADIPSLVDAIVEPTKTIINKKTIPNGDKKQKQLLNEVVVKKQYWNSGSWTGITSSTRSNIFEGLLFSVMDEPYTVEGVVKYAQNDIENLIRNNGGNIVKSPIKNSTIIAENKKDKSLQMKNYISSGLFDILDLDYILDCVRSGKLLDRAGYYIGFSHETMNTMDEDQIDIFGLSYETDDEIDVNRMKNALNALDEENINSQRKYFKSDKYKNQTKNNTRRSSTSRPIESRLQDLDYISETLRINKEVALQKNKINPLAPLREQNQELLKQIQEMRGVRVKVDSDDDSEEEHEKLIGMVETMYLKGMLDLDEMKFFLNPIESPKSNESPNSNQSQNSINSRKRKKKQQQISLKKSRKMNVDQYRDMLFRESKNNDRFILKKSEKQVSSQKTRKLNTDQTRDDTKESPNSTQSISSTESRNRKRNNLNQTHKPNTNINHDAINKISTMQNLHDASLKNFQATKDAYTNYKNKSKTSLFID